jgi:hypothetical protein
MSTKPHTHKTYETLRKKSFCTKGYAEIHIQRLFLDNKIGTGEILGMLSCLFYIWNLKNK